MSDVKSLIKALSGNTYIILYIADVVVVSADINYCKECVKSGDSRFNRQVNATNKDMGNGLNPAVVMHIFS